MQNPLSGAWTAFNNDPKYSTLRHAVIAGVAVFLVGVLQALDQIDFGGWTPIVSLIAAGAIRWLTAYSAQ